MKNNKTNLLKLDIDQLQKENKSYRELIELQRKQLEDFERLCLWAAKRSAPFDRSYIIQAVKANKEML